MNLRPVLWTVGATLVMALAGCEARERDATSDEVDRSAPVSATPEAANRAGPAESIIREDVLAETNAAAEAPAVQPVEMTLNFADADGKLPAVAASQLDELLAQPVVARGGCILIRGHTDSRGSDEQNLRASERRARLVAAYLAERGIDEGRLRVIALGERRPVAPNANPDGTDFPEGRAKNRRVTVEAMLPPGEGQPACDVAMVPRDGIEPPTP